MAAIYWPAVPPHGILIVNGDNTAAPVILYLQIVEGIRLM